MKYVLLSLALVICCAVYAGYLEGQDRIYCYKQKNVSIEECLGYFNLD